MLRAGIIGAGRIAWAYDGGIWNGITSVSHAACLDRHPNTECVAVFDPIKKSRDTFKEQFLGKNTVTLHSSLEEFLDENLDLVIVSSPTEHHANQVIACLKSQIPYLLIEKPVASNASEFEKIINVLHQHSPKTQTTVNYFRRFLPQTAYIKRFFQEAQATKKLVNVNITYSRDLATNGVHYLDLLGHLFDATSSPSLNWKTDIGTPNPSFGLTIGGCKISVIGLQKLAYHCLELCVTTQDGQMTLSRNGLDILHAPKIENTDYPGFFHLDTMKLAMPTKQTRAAMQNGTYLALCDLVSKTGLSPLIGSSFAQDLLDQVICREK